MNRHNSQEELMILFTVSHSCTLTTSSRTIISSHLSTIYNLLLNLRLLQSPSLGNHRVRPQNILEQVQWIQINSPSVPSVPTTLIPLCVPLDQSLVIITVNGLVLLRAQGSWCIGDLVWFCTVGVADEEAEWNHLNAYYHCFETHHHVDVG